MKYYQFTKNIKHLKRHQLITHKMYLDITKLIHNSSRKDTGSTLLMYQLTILFLVLIKSAILTDVGYYEVLGVSRQASAQEIRQAYKKLAVKLHPDKNVDSADQEKFLKITEAYETLKDAEKRRQYDLYGNANSYTRRYDYQSESEYNNLYYNGLYHKDQFVDTLSPKTYYTYLNEGFYFINFYSPFCPPCQNLVDHWKKLAELYKGIVKIGAVNCKYHNSFCYNSMRISSYPSLLFYPNGKQGNFVYYRGDHTFEALENFVLKYLKSKVHVPVITQIRKTDKPIAYVLGEHRIEHNTLIRIAYLLNGLVTITLVTDDDLRLELTKDESVTIVLKYKGGIKEIGTTEEKYIVNEIASIMPKVEQVDPAKLKTIRSKLRSGHEAAWVFYFTSGDGDKLLLHQVRAAFSHLNFGEIDCKTQNELCMSLQAEDTPSWGVLKRGGAYQKAPVSNDIRGFIQDAVDATRVHTLSASEFNRILNDISTWALLVAPYQSQWEHYVKPFMKTSMHFSNSININFGIMACTQINDNYCRTVTMREPVVLVQNYTRRFYYSGKPEEDLLYDFITLIKESPNSELSEQQILEIMDPSVREHTWLVAFLPANCGEVCDDLLFEWLIVAKKLRPLDFVKVGVLRCSNKVAFCNNVRIPTGRLYPISSGQHYSVNLQQLAQAPYIAEWALEHIDDTVQKLNWHTFSRYVIAEDLRPTSVKKPWLVYFHSPRCYRCYEMYPEFAIAGIFLNKAVELGKVNCLTERNICQNAHITSYPSLKLYFGRNQHKAFSSVVNIQVKSYGEIMRQVESELNDYLAGPVGSWTVNNHISHDEF